MKWQAHWERVYATTPIDRVGWYTPHLTTSLTFIQNIGVPRTAHIIDVGGGASTLVDDLLRLGYTSVSVLDLSARALELARERLGPLAQEVTWIEGDITSVELPAGHYDLWHDRAVFHFLTEPEDRERYLANLRRGLKPGGFLIMATFAPEAPPKCSGLPVRRYTLEQLQETLGPEFELVEHTHELHITPGGVEQLYLYASFQRRESRA